MCSLVLVIMAIELYKTRNQLAYLKTKDMEYAVKIKQIEQDLTAKEEYLDKLLTDPVFLERVVRERLGYTRPEEWIYRFPNDPEETTNLYESRPDVAARLLKALESDVARGRSTAGPTVENDVTEIRLWKSGKS